MLNVVKDKEIGYEPETATLWVDSSGVVAFLHRAPHDGYQLTRLCDGQVISFGKSKEHIVAGFCLLSCSVTIQNRAPGSEHADQRR